MSEKTTCIECGTKFEFGVGCFEFDDGDICATCYAEYEAEEVILNENDALLADLMP